MTIVSRTPFLSWLPFKINEEPNEWFLDLPISPDDLDIDIVEAIPASSFLSGYWLNRPQDCTFQATILSAGVYLLGMIGYSLTVPFRVITAAFRILILLKDTFLFLLGQKRKEDYLFTAWMTLRKSLEILSSLFGILCPPAGYFLDRQIDRLAEKSETRLYIYIIKIPIKASLQCLGFKEDEFPSQDDVNKNYRLLALKCHPDKFPDRTLMFQQLGDAKKILEDYVIKVK